MFYYLLLYVQSFTLFYYVKVFVSLKKFSNTPFSYSSVSSKLFHTAGLRQTKFHCLSALDKYIGPMS